MSAAVVTMCLIGITATSSHIQRGKNPNDEMSKREKISEKTL